MKLLKIRSARKQLKELLHYARHRRRMHEDLIDSEQITALKRAEQSGRSARRGRDLAAMKRAEEQIAQQCERVIPQRPHAKIRENVEVLFVAIAAAMAIRAYFFQPFKIPTGSMQPTLYGITVRAQDAGESTHLPARVAKFFLNGEVFLQNDTLFDRLAKAIAVGKDYSAVSHVDGYIRVHQTAQGIQPVYRDNFDGGKTITLYVGDTPHVVSRAAANYCRYGEYIRAGESMLHGVAKAGDYILVNRMKYNFTAPKRGDVVVFDAKDVARNAYYIKRMVGLPGEKISIQPPYLMVNGERPSDSRFDKLFNDAAYSGYVFGCSGSNQTPKIKGAGDSIQLADDEYLFFGDNTHNSLDGRYFGGVNRARLLGSAFFVGLPLDRAGWVETIH